MTLKQTKSRGFTIVELLIVIVVIAILAAITIVAYNGIQNRANTSAAQSAANTMVKKVEAYNALKSEYPKVTTTVTTDLNTYAESSLTGTNLAVGTPTAANGKTTLKVELCGTGAGAKITYWDYGTGALSTTPLLLGVTTGTCTAATA